MVNLKNILKFRNVSKCKILLKFKQALRKITADFCENTTLHGMKYVADKNLKSCERCFFGISIISVICILVILILQVYDKWYTSPIIVGINPKRSSIIEEPFPAVTICNLNIALNNKVAQIPKNSTEYTMLKLLCNRKVHKNVRKSNKYWNKLESFVQNISQSCEDMLLACRFSGRVTDCNELFHPLLTDGGLCCVFNMLHPQYMYTSHDWLPETLDNISSYPYWYDYVNWSAETGYGKMDFLDFYYPQPVPGIGEFLGLSVTLNVQKDKYYCSSSNSVGFKFAFHTPNEWTSVKDLGVFIEPGKETKIHIKPDKTETNSNLRSIKPEYRGCLFSNEKPLKFFTHYTQSNCEMEYMADLFFEFGKCNAYYMPKIRDNIRTCSPYHNQDIHEMVNLFNLAECLPSCNNLNFHIDAFSTKLLHKGFHVTNKIIKHLNDSYVQDNIAVVHMFFKDNTFRTYKQMEFIGLSDFISSIGGLMGLFIGFSFLSIAELIYFAVLRPIRSALEHFKNVQNYQHNLDNDIRQLSSSMRNSSKLRKLFKYRNKQFLKRSNTVFVQKIHTLKT